MNNAVLTLLLLTTLAGTAAAGRSGGGGSRGSGGGSRPSGSSGGSKPSSGYGGSSPSRPSRPTTVSSRNTNPIYKPVTSTGAPKTKSGGGGYSTEAKVAAAAVGGAAVGAAAATVAVPRGTFFYGGRYSSPTCRGPARYSSSMCHRGRSTTGHECREQIPLCPIPENVRERWYIGPYPRVEVVADASTCTVISDLGIPPATNDTADEEDASANTETKLTLDDCLKKVILDGTCASSRFTINESTGKCGCCASGSDPTPLELTDDWEHGDGLGDPFTSAVYSFTTSSAPFAVHGPPTHCISGSKLHWPEKVDGVAVTGRSGSGSGDGGSNATKMNDSTTTMGGGGYADRVMDCECGLCDRCGSPRTSYLDWSGPYAVPKSLGDDGVALNTGYSDDAGGTAPTYDPVDTCVCEAGNAECHSYSSFSTAAPGRTASAVFVTTVLASALGFVAQMPL